MKSSKIENQLYLKAGVAFDDLKSAIQTFGLYLQNVTPDATPYYYKARNYLRDAEKFCQDTFNEAKKLLGPLPAYASPEFEKWRSDFVSYNKILTENEEFGALKEELVRDEQISRWIEASDLERLLARSYESQKSGKRKLANIKVRIVLDRLLELLAQANVLKKKAMEKLQGTA
jgi:hypothetical protein